MPPVVNLPSLRLPARPLAGVLLAAAVVAGLSACGDGHAPAEAPPAAAAGERLTVRPVSVADLKPVAARVTTRDMAEARARIGGTLVRLNVREGDYVRRGQVIGVVADDRLDLQTRAFEAQVAAAAAEARRAEADFARVRQLYEQGIYARARFDQARAAAEAAQAAQAAAVANRAASAETSAQGAVLAPASGRVLDADVPAGSVVAPGQAIVTVTAGELLLRLELPEAQAAALAVGQTVRIDPRDLPGGAASGVVAQLYPSVSGGRVTADVAVPGLTADLIDRRVRVEVGVGARDAIVIPARYISTRHGVDFVRLLGRDGRASETAVQVTDGPSPDQREVLSGLRAGDVILAPAGAA